MSEQAHPMDMREKRIVVVGADQPVGRAVAVQASALGAMVAAIGDDEDALSETMLQLKEGMHQSRVWDLTNAEDLVKCMRGVAIGEITLDGICFVPAMEPPQGAGFSADTFRANLSTHLYPALALARALRYKKVHSAASSLVYVLSLEGLEGPAGQASFAASQGAIQAMTRALSLELTRHAIRVNCVATVGQHGAEGAKASTASPAPPLGQGTPEDVAQAVAFLLADTGRWITGTTLLVDGGFSLASLPL